MKRVIISVALATFLFSSNEIVLKMAGATFPPLQINLLRFVIGGLVLLPGAAHTVHQKHLKPFAHLPLFFLSGFVCVVISMTLFQLAVVLAPANAVAVVFSVNPVFALLFAYLLLGERMRRSDKITVVLALIGLSIIGLTVKLSHPFGLIVAILSAITWGLYSIISRIAAQKDHFNGILMTCGTFFAGSLELGVLIAISHMRQVAAWLDQYPQLKSFSRIPVFAGISWQLAPLLLYIGIGITGAGFALYFIAMEDAGVATASLVFFIKPGLAPILDHLILGEQIAPLTIVGIVVILLGSAVAFLPEKMWTSHHHLAE